MAQVTFQGNQVVPQGVLREVVHGTAIGSPYTESAFRELLDHTVRAVYEQRGRVRVAFTEVRAEPVNDVEGVHVFVKIDEGQSYELGKVAIAGPSPVDAAVLIKAGDFKTGDVANFDRVNEGLERIRKAVRRAGYLDVKVTPERSIDDAKKTVDVAVHIDAGAQYTMGKLTIVGLDLNGEAEILRIWTMKEGKTLNPEYPDFFLNRVKEEALFEGLGATKADMKVDAQKHTADVTLTFTAEDPTKPPGRRGAGAGRARRRLLNDGADSGVGGAGGDRCAAGDRSPELGRAQQPAGGGEYRRAAGGLACERTADLSCAARFDGGGVALSSRTGGARVQAGGDAACGRDGDREADQQRVHRYGSGGAVAAGRADGSGGGGRDHE